MTGRANEVRARRRLIFGVIVTIILGTGAGCQTPKPQIKVKPPVHSREDVSVTLDQARLRMRSMVDPMCGQVEQCADAIIAGTDDREVKLAALQWKIEAVPALREALFQPDPSIAASDTLVLCNQMSDYFESGDGSQAMGPASAQAAETCRRIEEEFAVVLASGTFSGDVSNARAYAKEWAAKHPIRHSIADRESTLTRVYEREFADALSMGKAIVEVTTTVDDLSRKIEIYSDQLFRQARWEIERLKLELMSELRAAEVVPLAERAVKRADQALETLNLLLPAAERALVVLQDAPQLVVSERESAVQAVRDETARMMAFLREERIAALEQLARERVTAVKDISQTMSEQRQQMANDARQITMAGIDYANRRLTWLVIVVLSAGFAGGILAIVLARLIFVRRGS